MFEAEKGDAETADRPRANRYCLPGQI